VQGQPLQAITCIAQVLEQLDVQFPVQPEVEDIQGAMAETQALLAGKSVAALIDLPPMTDPRRLAAMQLLATVLPAAHVASPNLFPLVVLKQVSLSITYGNAAISPFSYGVYGLILCGVALQIEEGYQFSQLALGLLGRLDGTPVRARTLLSVHAGTQYWKEHLRETFGPLQVCYQAALDDGDLEFAGYTALHHCDHAFFAGLRLPELATTMAAYRSDLARIKQSRNADAISIFQQAVVNLTVVTSDPSALSGDTYDATVQVEMLQKVNDRQVLFLLHLNRLILSTIFQEPEDALAAAEESIRIRGGLADDPS